MRDDDTHTADQYADHVRQLERIRGDYDAGLIGTTVKRRLIAGENARYYGDGDRLAVAREMPAPAFGIMHAQPVDPAPWAARIRRALGWAVRA